MAQYKYGQHFELIEHEVFDARHRPGDEVPNSGIYRCAICGDEIVAEKGDLLPPKGHHHHEDGSPTMWQLLVFAQRMIKV